MITIKIKKLNPKAKLPKYMTSGASGCDIYACVEKPVYIKPMERVMIRTGLAVEIPSGYELQIRSRSGLALSHGLIVLNSPATIDSDYRGEIQVLLVNISNETIVITNNDRIAQLVAQRVERIDFHQTTELTETERGINGLGSSGIKEWCID